ncbi:hypothetical protein J2W23_006278 [Variovorax boronicumulans]|uniref:hypothetical protein n=1 Tax=Variovorax boronicumulans TaxID=436515 RepID=UPI0027878131|nr:hypothetical protein [Variovorax boronicumulans]MDQ0017857.1 hypothetical protein [Variovorax boronicumulans]
MARVPSFPESSELVSAELLVLRACDDIDSLHVVQRAHACLEKLIGPQHASDTEEVYPSRTELSALIGLVNEELQRRIETAGTTIQSLRVALGKDGLA